jgi:acyl-coenzyme A synthetase/AMP-(fatty) acid ligase
MTPNFDGRTVSEWFRHTAAAGAGREFLHVPVEACRHYADSALTLTYGQAAAQVALLVEQIHKAGYRSRHRVALALDNRPAFFIHFLALAQLGVSVVPLNASMSPAELSYVIGHADIALAVTHAAHAAHVRAALPESIPLHVIANEARKIAGDGRRVADNGRVPDGQELAADVQRYAAPAAPPAAAADELALLYTSGTTGLPKGCILSNEYFLEIGHLYVGLGGYCRFDGRSDRLATPLPVTHMNALACSFMAMLMTGGCLIQLDRFHPSTWWQSIRSSRATAFHYLGVMPAMLLNAPATDQDDVSGSVRFAFGAGVDPRHQAAFEARFKVPLVEAWAMTETGAGAWITANQDPRHLGQRCFGRAPAGLAHRIVDDGGADVAPGGVGELLVRREGAQPRRGFFSGYYKDPAATELAWRDGWFHTGDLVHTGADGSFFFVDRSKNIVRRSGENIAAVEVESALQTHADVAATAVCPVADEIRGEEVFAFVVLRPEVSGTADTALRLQAHCRQALAYYKVPGYIAFRTELPQTASQKLARATIKAQGAAAVGSAEAFDLRHLKKRPHEFRDQPQPS